MMNWESLFTSQRTGQTGRPQTDYNDGRHAYIRDYDRIIFSSAFRRLQNKTQVFPLPGAVFVHNRLTHSLEVASVGRSLAKACGEKIAAKYGGDERFKDFYRHEFHSVIAAACLAHDIGNPPFGHSGEDAIRAFFSGLPTDKRQMLTDNMSTNKFRDLELFEGNSNAFRVLTHSFNEPEPGGYRLTYPTLAAIVKYPCSSLHGFDKKSGTIATRKSGFFDAELDTYRKIASTLGMEAFNDEQTIYPRHPFVYLTEAADDICYRVIDLEDAHRLHIVSTEKFMDLFLPFFETETDYFRRDYIEFKLKNIHDDNQKVQYIRARWIALMTEKLSETYLDFEEQLLAGTLNNDLLGSLPQHIRELTARINAYSVTNIYNYKSVVEIEIAGYHVIGGLLDAFVNAVLQPELPKSKKLIKLVSKQFPLQLDRRHLYNDMLSLLDFIAGMTDLYALDLYRKITGIVIPELR